LKKFNPKVNKVKSTINKIKPKINKVGKLSKPSKKLKSGLKVPKMKKNKKVITELIGAFLVDTHELEHAEATNVMAYSPYGKWCVILHYKGKNFFDKLREFESEREAKECENLINQALGLI
jgi:hypothetical protein